MFDIIVVLKAAHNIITTHKKFMFKRNKNNSKACSSTNILKDMEFIDEFNDWFVDH